MEALQIRELYHDLGIVIACAPFNMGDDSSLAIQAFGWHTAASVDSMTNLRYQKR
jgi:hypothetical protein